MCGLGRGESPDSFLGCRGIGKSPGLSWVERALQQVGLKKDQDRKTEKNGVDSKVREEVVFSGLSHYGWYKE